jgi:hypothetical protein
VWKVGPSRALVDERLLLLELDDITICYFFFKDISDDQRSAMSALSALLHQLFSPEKGAPLSKHALPEFAKEKDDKICTNFEIM